MKRKSEKHILVSSPRITELLEKGGEEIQKVNVPSLADYSTRFENVR